MTSRILVGDVLVMLGTLEDASIDCVVTSPPYYGLRDYQVEGQIGLEPTLSEFVATMVKVFGEVARVLKPSGTVWLNLGDSYTSGGRKSYTPGASALHPAQQKGMARPEVPNGLKPKDLCGAPWRVAFGLQDDGWYLRQEIIWHKPNPMPESVRDRCTKAHESIFLLAHPASGGKYYYDADAVRERHKEPWRGKGEHESLTPHSGRLDDVNKEQATFTVGVRQYNPLGRNKRSVWTITTKPYSQAHFATFPPELPRTCILAGTSEKGICPDCGLAWVRVGEKKRVNTRPGYTAKHGDDQWLGHETKAGLLFRPVTTTKTLGWQPQCDCDSEPVPATVLDPFAGAGTTLLVANQLQRHAIGIELNPEYAAMAEDRIYSEAPLLNQVALG